MYTCGPTAYLSAHIGNLRTYIFEDILKRALIFNGLRVKHVMNITDVGHLTSDADEGDDKIIKSMREQHLPFTKEAMIQLTQKYTTEFFSDAKDLNILPPDIICKATEHVPQMIELIKKIIANEYAYETNTAVYFDISKYPNYGKMARLKLKALEPGARVEVDPQKKDPRDFVLWFKATGKHKDHIMQWDSPWGKGFPGWHIECSAMSTMYLGEQFDIHCGGKDLIPVHHTNEIAQTEAATGKLPWVKYWIHGEYLELGNEKMSKSKGDIFLLNDLKAKGYSPLVFRYLCIGAHYRTPLNFSLESMNSAKNALEKLQNKVLEFQQEKKEEKTLGRKFLTAFHAAIDDDLNTPNALAVLWNLVKEQSIPSSQKYSLLLEFDKVFGLDLDLVSKKDIPKNILSLVKQREEERKQKNWKKADVLREKIRTLGFDVDDSSNGPLIRRY